MVNLSLVGRTVRIVKDYTENTYKSQDGGSFVQKRITFVVAVNRAKDQADYFLVRAEGRAAENFNKYCTEKDSNGKLVSRLINIVGSLETYKKPIMIDTVAPGKINGQWYNVPVHIEEDWTHTVVVANAIEFLDKSSNSSTGKSVATAPEDAPDMTPCDAPENAEELEKQFAKASKGKTAKGKAPSQSTAGFDDVDLEDADETVDEPVQEKEADKEPPKVNDDFMDDPINAPF